ncbi:MAG TPA: cytochrome c3 family protein [Gemmatimonadales bacterium]
MRSFAVGIVAVVCLGGGALIASRVSPAQQGAPSAPDSSRAPSIPAADTGDLAGPRQPIFFRHDIHAGQFKIACQYCHYSVGIATEPGIPSLETCMGCHLVIPGADSGDRAEVRKLRQYWNDRDKPDAPRLEWVRVHTLARHAHFPHMLHIKALGPVACGACHGDVARMPQVWEVNNVNNMGFCINCHLERRISRDCSVCHY